MFGGGFLHLPVVNCCHSNDRGTQLDVFGQIHGRSPNSKGLSTLTNSRNRPREGAKRSVNSAQVECEKSLPRGTSASCVWNENVALTKSFTALCLQCNKNCPIQISPCNLFVLYNFCFCFREPESTYYPYLLPEYCFPYLVDNRCW